MNKPKFRGLAPIAVEVLLMLLVVAAGGAISGYFLWNAYETKQQAEKAYVQAQIQGVAYLRDGQFQAAFNAPVEVVRIGYGYYHVDRDGNVREEIIRWEEGPIKCDMYRAPEDGMNRGSKMPICIDRRVDPGVNMTYVHVRLGNTEKVFRWRFVEVKPDVAREVAQQVAQQVASQVAQQVAQQVAGQVAQQVSQQAVQSLAVAVAQIQQQLQNQYATTGYGGGSGGGSGNVGWTSGSGGSDVSTGGGSGQPNTGTPTGDSGGLTTYVGYLQAIVTDYIDSTSDTRYYLRTGDSEIPLDLSNAKINTRDFFWNYVGTGRLVYVTGYWSGNVFKVVEIGDAQTSQNNGGGGGGGGGCLLYKFEAADEGDS